MACEFDWERKSGDELPTIEATLTHLVNGQVTALNLAGATVTISIRRKQGGEVIVAAAAVTVTSATLGTVRYSPSGALLTDPGVYEVEFRVTFTGGDKARIPTQGFKSLRVWAGI